MNYYFLMLCVLMNAEIYPTEDVYRSKSFSCNRSHLAMLGVAIGSCIQSAPKFFAQISANIFKNQSLSEQSETLSIIAGGVTLLSGLYLWRSNNFLQRENFSLLSQQKIKDEKILKIAQELSLKSKDVDALQKNLDNLRQKYESQKNDESPQSFTHLKKNPTNAIDNIDLSDKSGVFALINFINEKPSYFPNSNN